MRPLRRHTLVFVLLLAVAVGCDTVVQDEAEPPELIPAQAFTVQTALFQQSRSGAAKIGPHFMAAVMRAWPVATMLDTHLEAPARLTQAALAEAPAINRNGTWVWTGTVPIDGQPVAFTLTGRPMGDQVDWRMEVAAPEPARSQQEEAAAPSPPEAARFLDESSLGDETSPTSSPPFGASSTSDSTATDSTTQEASGGMQPDGPSEKAVPEPARSTLSQDIQAADSTFVLYTAKTDRKGQRGSWRLYDTVDGERTNVLNAQFEIEKATKKKVTLHVPASAPEHGGDSVVYAHDEHQRRFHWTRGRARQSHRVTWNANTHEGAITATNYNEGQKACWGNQLDDADCTSE